MFNGKLGVGLISFNRPHYFAQLVGSLEEQTFLSDTEFHLFQDGAQNRFSRDIHAKKEDIQECVNIFRDSSLPNKTPHIRSKNWGNGIQQFEAVEFMADHYDYFLMIEDDVLLSPHYFRLIRVMIDQYFGLPEVFSLSLSFRRKCAKDDIGENLSKIGFIHEHWWAECWSSEKWKQSREYFLKYFRFIKDCDYLRRPHARIKDFFHAEGHNIPQTSQDAGKDYMLHKTGMKRLNSIVNRGFYLGEKGMHFSKDKYDAYRFAEFKPFVFEDDAERESFDLI